MQCETSEVICEQIENDAGNTSHFLRFSHVKDLIQCITRKHIRKKIGYIVCNVKPHICEYIGNPTLHIF